MPVTVLVVDDSSFFRRRITEIINSDEDFKVVGQAANGREAVEKAQKLKPDLITMDYEMPFLDGISAVKEIMQFHQVPILMFSSLTYDGARTTLDALDAGAKDFLPKSFESVSDNAGGGPNGLLNRLRAIVKMPSVRQHKSLQSNVSTPAKDVNSSRSALTAQTVKRNPERPTSIRPIAETSPAVSPRVKAKVESAIPVKKGRKLSIRPKICVIGSSTGGPMALQGVLKCLPASMQFPIVIAQHMPAAFTQAFADRLNSLCDVRVKHAENGDKLMPGCVYVAPGGMQTIIKDASMTLAILEGDNRLNYKPCVDLTFASAAKACPGKVLAIVLTGMGADGADGAKLLKQSNSEVWIQDEESCVVFGMPQAVMKRGFYDDMMSIDRVGPRLAEVATSGCT